MDGALCEDLLCPLDAGNEAIEPFGHRVEIETGAAGRRDPELVHQRLVAVVARAHAYSLGVEDLGDVMRMDSLQIEGDDSGAALERGAVKSQAGQLTQPLKCVGRELMLVGRDC